MKIRIRQTKLLLLIKQHNTRCQQTMPHVHNKTLLILHVRIYFVIQIFYKFTTCILVFTESNTMAKSLRSKWKRKMRAVKRVRYGEKENKVLEKILKNSDERKKLLENVTETCKMLRCNIGNCTLKHGPQPLGELTNVCHSYLQIAHMYICQYRSLPALRKYSL